MLRRIQRTVLWVMVVAAGALACAGLNSVLPPPDPADGLKVYGARIYYDSSVQQRMSEAQFAAAFEAAAAYWDTKFTAAQGWIFVQRGMDPWVVADEWMWGLTYHDLQRVDFSTPRPDCPAMVLLHEWGHAAVGLKTHDDPRFSDPAIYSFLVQRGVCKA